MSAPLCAADPDQFFDGDARVAQKLCQQCPVRPQCEDLVHAIEINFGRQYGVWGGLSKRQRRRKWPCKEVVA